jgi:hypothetical protein
MREFTDGIMERTGTSLLAEPNNPKAERFRNMSYAAWRRGAAAARSQREVA